MEGPPLHIVLVEPQIPPNTGNIARLCAATACELILVGELGFELSDSALKRAGLDYWEYVNWRHVEDREVFFAELAPGAFHLLTTHAEKPYTQIPAAWGDSVIFGKETAGLPNAILERNVDDCYTIPMFSEGVRSLNLSSAVAVVTYDILRRIHPFAHPPSGSTRGKSH